MQSVTAAATHGASNLLRKTSTHRELNHGRRAPASALNVGVQSSAFSGKALQNRSVESAAGHRRASRRQKSSALRVEAATSTTTVLDTLKETLQRIFGGPDDGDEVEVLGKVVLAKKNNLDLVDLGAVFLDNTFDALGRKVFIQLVSNDLEAGTNVPKKTSFSSVLNWWSNDGDLVADEFTYSVNFKVPKNFGEAGAIVVQNKHMNEFFLKSLSLEFPDKTRVDFFCNSWIYPEDKYSSDRIFFSNKTYLPSATPEGLKDLKELEFQQKRGDGTGRRQVHDRIYDFDVYNDLGKPDTDPATRRPVLGGGEFKYPRRCRTGRPRCETDPVSEMPTSKLLENNYVPRDEAFQREKNSTFYASALKGLIHKVVPAILDKFDKTKDEFDSMEEIFDLYKAGVDLGGHLDESNAQSKKPEENGLVLLQGIFRSNGDKDHLLHYPQPGVISKDDEAWKTDEEFGRQFLAGLNPLVIRALTEYPPKSTLDPKQFPSATALKDSDIEPHLEVEGLTVAQAIEQKRLFTVDYRDIFLPYVERINEGGLAKIYAPRAIFFHTKEGQMKPVAIELSLPPTAPGGNCVNRVLTPPPPGSDEIYQLWELAKMHVRSVDFGYHELVSHWMSTHAVTEPFIISTNRQLSSLHPIYGLLTPLFKNTMTINANARQSLIAGKGVIELGFSPGTYAIRMSAVVYDALWRFDTQCLPRDLIARGMAEPADDSHPGGVKLVVEDYPYAKDGLELWDAIKEWVSKYVNHIYNSSDEAVKSDPEIQAWWNEIVNVGHADKKDAPWWPKVDSIDSLVDIISTMAWISGPHHAAVNFGQYAYAAFMPNRPPTLRKHIPKKGDPDYEMALAQPEKFLLSMLSSQSQTTIIMTTVELLSMHSVDEEYIGTRLTDNWTSDPVIKEAFKEFGEKLQVIKRNIEQRNKDPTLRNRTGPIQYPYKLLVPDSVPGITGQGIPNSISI